MALLNVFQFKKIYVKFTSISVNWREIRTFFKLIFQKSV